MRQAYDYWQDQPGSIPQRRRCRTSCAKRFCPLAPGSEGNTSGIVSPRRQFRSCKTRKKGQIGAQSPLPTRWTESESSGNRSRAKAASLSGDRGTLTMPLRPSRAPFQARHVARMSVRQNANALSRQCRARYATQETIVRPRPCALVSS